MEKGEEYRLTKIDEVQKIIQHERDKRAAISTRYKRCIKAINFIDEFFLVLSIGLGISVIGILATTFAPSTLLILEGAALGAGGLNFIDSHINNKISIKAEMHQTIKTLAEVKLNTISDHVSKSLDDSFISDQEHSLILSELDKFNVMKEDIRTKFKSKIERQKKFSKRNARTFIGLKRLQIYVKIYVRIYVKNSR